MSSRNLFSSVVEGLEDRRLMSGTVQVFAVGDTLTIRGDKYDNQIALSQDANGALKVSGLGGTCVDLLAITTAIKNVQVNLWGGDDTCAILSPISVTNFSFNGGAGDNQLIAAGNVKAAGTVTIDGSDAQAATGAVTVGTTEASMARGEVSFDDTHAIGAYGSVRLAGLKATAASGDVTIPGFYGTTAEGTISFTANLTAGNTVTISDGKHSAVTFTAIAQNADPAKGQFNIGATAAQTMQNFISVVNWTFDANAFTIVAAQVGITATAQIDNTVVGANGNDGISASGAAISFVQMKGGSNPAAAGDSIVLNDGKNPAQVFTAIADDKVLGANQFYVGADRSETLDNLAAAINKTATTQGVSFTLTAEVFGDTLVLNNTTLGTAGNQPITFNAQAQAWKTDAGMTGGTNDFKAGDFITLSDGIHAPQTYTAIAVGAPAPTQADRESGVFQIQLNAADTVADLVQSINAVYNAQVPNAPVGTKKSFIEAYVNWWSDESSQTFSFYVDSSKLVGQYAGQAEAANSAKALTDADGQWAVTDLANGKNAVVLSAGDTITLNDGAHNAVTFKAVAANPGANEFLVAFTPHDQAVAFAAAVNAAGLNITATVDENSSDVDLVNTQVGEIGNGTAQSPRITFALADTKATVTNDYPEMYANHIYTDDFSGGADVKQTWATGYYVVVSDGVSKPVVFTAIATTPAVGSPNFQIGADAAATAQNLINAINGYNNGGVKLNLIAGHGTDKNTVTLVNTVAGAAGNFDGINNAYGFGTVVYMDGGRDADNLGAGATVTLNDGATSVTLTAVSAGTTPGANQFQIGASKAETAANLAAAINALADFNITASTQEVDGDVQVLLINTNAGIQGNQEIKVTDLLNDNLYATDMGGGSSGTLNVSRDFSTSVLGSGSNSIELNGATIGRRMTILGGEGADNVALANVTVQGATDIRLGHGDDVLTIDASNFKARFNAGLGLGDDVMQIDSLGVGGTTFCGTMTVNAASGADVITDAAETRYATHNSNGGGIGVLFAGAQGQGSLLNNNGTVRGQASDGGTLSPTYDYVNGLLA